MRSPDGNGWKTRNEHGRGLHCFHTRDIEPVKAFPKNRSLTGSFNTPDTEIRIPFDNRSICQARRATKIGTDLSRNGASQPGPSDRQGKYQCSSSG